MVEKNTAGADSKRCSCPVYNSNASCVVKNSKKKVSKSKIFNEEPPRLQAPVIVSYLKEKQNRFPKLPNSRWRKWKVRKSQYEYNAEKFNICQWYKRKRALKSLKDQTKREQERENRRKREEYERERITDILYWEYGKHQKAAKEEEKRKKQGDYQRERINDIIWLEYENQQKQKAEEKRRKFEDSESKKQLKAITKHEPTPHLIPRKLRQNMKKREVTIIEPKYKHRPWSRLRRNVDFPDDNKEKKIKKNFVKEKSASAKPRARTKQVSVKRYKPKESITSRFVNCCYRICCQFYCCLTCLLIISLTLIIVL